MRHKWKKTKPQYITEDDTLLQIQVRDSKECIHCGLMKGTITRRWFPVLIYFKNNVILSQDRLPYKCYEAPNSMFISEKDFMV